MLRGKLQARAELRALPNELADNFPPSATIMFGIEASH